MEKSQRIVIIGEENDQYKLVAESIVESFEVQLIETRYVRNEVKKQELNIAILLKSKTENPIDTIHYMRKENPNLTILFIHDSQDFELYRDVIRAGATDFLVIPDELPLLNDKLNSMVLQRKTMTELAATSGTFQRGSGQVFAFYSGKGGSGKTFLSSLFAQTLKLESTAQVLYIDLNLQYGGAETFLGMESSRSIIDLKPVIREINEHHIRNVAEKEPHSKLDVLLSPRDAELAESIDAEFIESLLKACRRSYDFVIVDIPSYMDEVGAAVLEDADRVYYVMTLDTPAIKGLKHVEVLFQRLGIITNDRMDIVINNSGSENELTKKDLEKFVKYPITAQIRRDAKGVLSAINQGNPIRKEPKEKKLIPAAKDIQKWVTSMLK
ncbi:AAA family ATPase [Heyndrickxia oleronia]|uniref:AAA family ATPase n=1 Tax=Heyndrickxia oleronia TaxID=38875 RepID=A0AAW6T465_9BACI|nr:AAA family ATPase [Heyndrickxia oleronia]MDH5164172.1 AAA family ATPase [Heyndrickxia oleronia]